MMKARQEDQEENRQMIRDEIRASLRDLFNERRPNTDNVEFLDFPNRNDSRASRDANPINANLLHASVNQPRYANVGIGTKAKPDTYDGLTPWSQYHKQFLIAAQNNKWSNTTKAAQLIMCLRRKARVILEYLSIAELNNYNRITQVLNEEFSDEHFARMNHNLLESRKRGENENIATFGEDIKKLARLAYPTTPIEARDRIACSQFIRGLRNRKIEYQLRAENQSLLYAQLSNVRLN